MSEKGWKELLKSFARFMWFGVLGLLSAFLVSLTTNADLINAVWTVPFVEMTVPIGLWILAGTGFAIKALDRYIHKSDETKLKGLAPGFLQN